MTKDQLTLRLLRLHPRSLTVAMATAKATEILAKQKEDEARRENSALVKCLGSDPIKQLNNLSL